MEMPLLLLQLQHDVQDSLQEARSDPTFRNRDTCFPWSTTRADPGGAWSREPAHTPLLNWLGVLLPDLWRQRQESSFQLSSPLWELAQG